MGWPVDHSLSPPMQNAAIEALGLDWVYVALPVAPENLPQALAGARAMGMVGMNLTIPHKQEVLGLLNQIDPTAKAIGAVNTVHFTDEGAFGYNTDAEGYVGAVQAEGRFDFKGAHVLQIGAGGVGRAMALGAAKAGARRLTLLNRTLERADRLADEIRRHAPQLAVNVAGDPQAVASAAREADLIANATSLGMKADDPLPLAAELIEARHVVFDTVYAPVAETPLLKAAAQAGARAVQGLGMLARQGARALAIWSGREPDEALMEQVLREQLARHQ